MNSPVFFGDWVKKRRKALDLTQEELAQRTGCSIFSLRKIESGERKPSKPQSSQGASRSSLDYYSAVEGLLEVARARRKGLTAA